MKRLSWLVLVVLSVAFLALLAQLIPNPDLFTTNNESATSNHSDSAYSNLLSEDILTSPAYTMTEVWNLTNNGEIISDLAIASDGSRLITGTMTGIATVYDQNGSIVWETKVPGSLIVGCQENGSAFIVGSQEDIYSNKGGVRSYDGNGSEVWYATTGSVAALGVPGRNNRIVVGNREGDLIVFGGQGEVLAKINDFPQTNVVVSISVTDDGNLFAYALHEMYPRVRFFYVDTQRKGSITGLFDEVRTGYGGAEQMTALALSSDGKYLVSSNGEGSHGILCLFGNGRMIWSKDMAEITDIAILPNGSSMFAGTANGDILGYSRSGDQLFVFSTGSAVTSLSLATDKNLLAVGNSKGNLYLIDDKGNLFWTAQIEEFPIAEISRVEISRDGSSLVVLVNRKNLYYFMIKPGPVPSGQPIPSPDIGR